eukprot:CAMPEP_0183336970 /NCGR_PEP_ID=MMETSP0164_2-20130417/4799_1 /TAXON_ID=221442 /ORGANISM="Coccolithus pelagicus ssp braarudi, Strain PLY182g" /LENGTH=217 /DNA_ID=CAMNT_0025506603 /DNA_START=32 /DNA_END=682 /DNA_ORIENTATION=+
MSRGALDGELATRRSMEAFEAHVTRGFDAIGWVGLLSDASVGCIEPPPFGKQCTLPRHEALRACIRLPRCIAITCPSQEPYERGQPRKRIYGPICQLRSRADSTNAERGHGMCKPSSCVNLVLTRMNTPHDWVVAARAAGTPPRSALVRFASAQSEHIQPFVDVTLAPAAYMRLQLANGEAVFAVTGAARNPARARKMREMRGRYLLPLNETGGSAW